MVHSAQPDAFIELDHVTAGYGKGPDVFRDASFRIDRPGLYRLHGPNGQGKSTLIEVLSGYLHPREGEARVNGLTATSPEAHELRRVCRTEPALYPMMGVRDHLVFASRWNGAPVEHALERAVAYGLGPWLDTPAEALSTGNRRRLWLVQCTVGQFRTVILDEPFNGLDDRSVALLCAELEVWANTRCVLLTAHLPPAELAIDERLEWNPRVSLEHA
ncbi:hypothetical protein GCM10027027_08000 [Neomicrococcus lactis]